MSRRADPQHQGGHPSCFGAVPLRVIILLVMTTRTRVGMLTAKGRRNLRALENGKSCEGHPEARGRGAGPRCSFVANEGAVPSQAQRRRALSLSLQAQKALSQLLSPLAKRLPLRRQKGVQLCHVPSVTLCPMYPGSSRAVNKECAF